MKSAIAKTDEHTYTYPEPLDPHEEQPLSVFNKAHIDAEIIEAIDAGEPAPWVRLKIPRSKGLRDGIADATQALAQIGANGDGATLKSHIAKGNRAVFELLVVDWSVPGAEGMHPTAENFAKLDVWASSWIQACIVNAQMRAEPDFREAPKNGNSSSSDPESGPVESASAAESA